MKVKVYNGTFVKTSGEDRTMSFVRIGDLPPEFLGSKVNSNAKTRKYAEGIELVWDIVSKDFRTFNHNTIVGTLSEPQDMVIIDE